MRCASVRQCESESTSTGSTSITAAAVNWVPVRVGSGWTYVRSQPSTPLGKAAPSSALSTAPRVNDIDDVAQTARQDFFLKALVAHGAVDVVEEGYYASWAKESVMSADPSGTRSPSAFRDRTASSTWSEGLCLRRSADGTVLATIRKREEKGSDVNVASHLLENVLTGQVDAAIVVSNDSDLALPLRIARNHVPVGIINPGNRPLAGALKGAPGVGAGRHW